MKSDSILICIIVLTIFPSQEADTSSQLRIEPDVDIITKYIGDSVNLTCSYVEEYERNKNLISISSPDITSTRSLNWILPSNGEERVEIREDRGVVSVFIKNLKETNNGNYSCDLIEDNLVISKKHIYLAVLARGSLSSCTHKSFFCKRNLCIPDRYKCDGLPDCPDGLDESHEHCGSTPCFGKLSCDDGRCLSPSECCIEPSKSPPNCTLHASIRCCRQLIHPALLDQDLYYLASRPNMRQDVWYYYTTSSLLVAGFVLLMAFVIIAMVLSIRFRMCRPYSPTQYSWYRPPPWNSCNSNRLLNPSQNPTDQYLLQSSSSSAFDRPEYIGRIPGLRSELLSPGILRTQSRDDSTLILVPLPRSRLSESDHGPPPSYQQVVEGPPPPYSSQEFSNQQSLDPLEAPLLSISSSAPFNNNNNGDSTCSHAVAQNRNFSANRNSFVPNTSTTGSGESSSSLQSSPRLFRSASTLSMPDPGILLRPK